jgi:hypothetical protein
MPADTFFMDVSPMDLNPATGLPWTLASLADAQIGPFIQWIN